MAGIQYGSEIVWNKDEISKLFKTSGEIGQALIQEAEKSAEQNSEEVLSIMHSPQRVKPYRVELRQLRKTQVAVIVPTTKAVAAVGRKHNLPRWQ